MLPQPKLFGNINQGKIVVLTQNSWVLATLIKLHFYILLTVLEKYTSKQKTKQEAKTKKVILSRCFSCGWQKTIIDPSA